MNNEGLEYQGYVYTIYSILFTKENTAYNIMLEQVYENTSKPVNGLKSLNSNIKKYIDIITTKKTPEEIMKLHSKNVKKTKGILNERQLCVYKIANDRQMRYRI